MEFLVTKLTGKSTTVATIACPTCGREFQRNRKTDLTRHMRIHTQDKPFSCPYPQCDKAFKQLSALRNHSNYHVRDRSFTCDICGINFFDKPTYNRHNREKHDLTYVFACGVRGCGKSFKRKPVLKGHMQEKHGIVLSDEEANNQRVYADGAKNPTKPPFRKLDRKPGPYPQATPKISSRSHATSFCLSNSPDVYGLRPSVKCLEAYSLPVPINPAYPSFSCTNSGINAGLVQDMSMYAKMYAPDPSANQCSFNASINSNLPSSFWMPGSMNNGLFHSEQKFDTSTTAVHVVHTYQPAPQVPQIPDGVIDPSLSPPLDYSGLHGTNRNVSPVLSSRPSSSSGSLFSHSSHSSRSPSFSPQPGSDGEFY